MSWVVLSVTGLVGRIDAAELPPPPDGSSLVTRADHDIIASAADADQAVGLLTDQGRAIRLALSDLPVIDGADGPLSLAAGIDATDLPGLEPGQRAVAVFSLDLDAPPLAIGTRAGTVKRVVPEYRGWDSWEMITLKDGDTIVGARPAADADELVFITSDAQLLRLAARAVRPQGRAAGGMAGIALASDAHVVAFTAIARSDNQTAVVATVAGSSDPAASGLVSAKVSPFTAFPAKGRATGGVRCHRFSKGQDCLTAAWVGLPPARACGVGGQPRTLPALEPRRDASGTPLGAPIYALG